MRRVERAKRIPMCDRVLRSRNRVVLRRHPHNREIGTERRAVYNLT
jgi:hypothetical protein